MRTLKRVDRWPGAWALVVIGSVLNRLLLPVGLSGIAIVAEQKGVGMFNLISLQPVVAFVVTLVLLDFSVWLQHVFMHRIPALWRLHRVHHADPDIDVTTALRFHPAEILFSLFYKAFIVILIGPPAVAIFWFEVVLNALAQFNHANLKLPMAADRILRFLVVTPDMHRVHHSTIASESNRNFGFCLSIWDVLFRTYKAQPDLGHDKMEIGQQAWRSGTDQRTDKLITQPLKRMP